MGAKRPRVGVLTRFVSVFVFVLIFGFSNFLLLYVYVLIFNRPVVMFHVSYVYGLTVGCKMSIEIMRGFRGFRGITVARFSRNYGREVFQELQSIHPQNHLLHHVLLQMHPS